MRPYYSDRVDPKLLDQLRLDLSAADYSSAALSALWGSAAEGSRHRGVFAPARRALETCEPSPLGVLGRVFLLGERVSAAELDLALPTLQAEGAAALGLVTRDTDLLRAALSLNPVDLPDPASKEPGDSVSWWVISDLDDQLRRGPARPDHVMGVGGATRSLLALTPFAPGATVLGLSALDLGTGCGIIAMYLARAGADRVVATDISPRALRFAAANARLNGFDGRIEFREGDLFDSVAGELFDLILSNPPFVITPRGAGEQPRYEYRDGGMTGDELAAKVVRQAPAHLASGGTLLCLANWEVAWGGSGLDRVAGWIEDASESSGSALDAWVIERDRVDPAQYAETWARDGGARPGEPEFDALIDAWLDDFAARKVVSVGLGSVRVRRSHEQRTEQRNVIRTEQAPGMFASDGPGWPLARAFVAGTAAERMSVEDMLATRWVRSERLYEEREYRPGSEDPRAISLVIDTPIGRREAVDPLLAAALGVCDGDLTLGQIAGALATVMEVDEAAATAMLVESVRELSWHGMVAPSDR